jgi:hypothetical protein
VGPTTYPIIWHVDSFSIRAEDAASCKTFMARHGVRLRRADSISVQFIIWNQYRSACPFERLREHAERWSRGLSGEAIREEG